MSEFSIVNKFLEEFKKTHREIVENECGTPIKITVDWERMVVIVQGPIAGRELQINDILRAYHKKIPMAF